MCETVHLFRKRKQVCLGITNRNILIAYKQSNLKVVNVQPVSLLHAAITIKSYWEFYDCIFIKNFSSHQWYLIKVYISNMLTIKLTMVL